MSKYKVITGIFLVIVAAIIAHVAFGAGEVVATADAGQNLTGGGRGPARVDAWANGTANIQFFWLNDSGAVVRSSPNYALRNDRPRGFPFNATTGPDSCYIDLTAATEVIVTW